MKKTSKLRELLKRPGTIASVGCWDVLSAKQIEQQGFEVAYMSGACVAASLYGKNDYGTITQTEMVEVVRRIAMALKIPLLADADDGYGTPLEVHRTVSLYEKAGAAAMHIEDMNKPKHCVEVGGGSLGPKENMIRKIEAAVDARKDPDFVIMARTDIYEGMDEAISRGNAYGDAGADMLWLIGFSSIDDIKRACKEIKIPILVVQHTGFKVNPLSMTEYEDLGVKWVNYVQQGHFAAYSAARDWLKKLKPTVFEERTRRPPEHVPFSFISELEETLDGAEDRRIIEKYC